MQRELRTKAKSSHEVFYTQSHFFGWLNHYFFFVQSGLSFTKKVHHIILCQICGVLRKRSLIVICPFRSNLIFRGFSRTDTRQKRQFVVRFVPEQTIRFSLVQYDGFKLLFLLSLLLGSMFLDAIGLVEYEDKFPSLDKLKVHLTPNFFLVANK